MSFWLDRLQLALDALKDNQRRTLLSLLGITIGIAAVITVGTVSRSANGVVYAELESFGLTSIWINRDYRSTDPDKRTRRGSGITQKDYLTLKSSCCDSVLAMTSIARPNSRSRVQRGNRYSNAKLLGVDIDHLTVVNDTLTAGRYFRPIDIQRKTRVAVIAPDARRDLFGRSPALGERIRINGESFKVIGLLGDKSRDFLSSIGSVDNTVNARVLIPYTRLLRMSGSDDITYLQAKAQTLSIADTAGDQMIERLSHITRHHFDYEKETMRGYINTADRILGTVQLVGIIAASISLLVGGMGIANIMSTAVVERTREIGLRKAIGARGADIRWQFLFEAAIVSLIGGVLGTALGLSLVYAVSALSGVKISGVVSITIIALVSSMLVGIIAGFLPARRAARLDPVTALRYE